MEFIPIEDDLLSLEMDDVARDIYMAGLMLGIPALLNDVVAERRRHTSLLLFPRPDDCPKSIWTVSKDAGKRGCSQGKRR